MCWGRLQLFTVNRNVRPWLNNWSVYTLPNRSLLTMTEPTIGDQIIHTWQNPHFLGPLYDFGISWATLWLWHFLEPLFDCFTSWNSIIVTLPEASLWLSHCPVLLYDCGTSCGLSMIVKLPGALYDCKLSWASVWLWHFMWLPYDCGLSWGLSMIVTLSKASLW